LQVGDGLRRAGGRSRAASFRRQIWCSGLRLPDASAVQALALQLLRAFNGPLFHTDIGLRITITISIGIAEAPAMAPIG
jgi:GGDEF domain-containing protein